MSQFFVNSSAAPLPPGVPTEFQTQDGTATPLANSIIIDAFDSEEDVDNGIITRRGGVDGTGPVNEVSIIITNRIQGTEQTSGAQTLPIITFTPTVIGTYAIEVRVSAYNTTPVLGLGAGYSMFAAIRFDGTDSHLCQTPDRIVNEEGTMTNANCTITVSGSGPDVFVNGVGYIGQVINWAAVGLYTFVGV